MNWRSRRNFGRMRRGAIEGEFMDIKKNWEGSGGALEGLVGIQNDFKVILGNDANPRERIRRS